MNRITRCLSVAILGLSCFAKAADPAGTIIVDNKEASFSGNGWITKSNAKGQYGNDYGFASTSEDDRLKCLAIYKPKIIAAGTYNVDIMYPAGENRYTKAEWTVSYDGGQVTIPVNQQINGGTWVSLVKAKPFSLGNGGFVQVANTGATGSVIIADAVRFVPVSTTAPTGKTYSLNAIAAAGGTIVTSPAGPAFTEGSTVLVSARANNGFVFDGWMGDAKGFKNPLKLTMTKNLAVTANFIPAGVGLIIDNPDAEFPGNWKLSTTNWGGARYEDYQFSSAKVKADGKGLYKPNIPKAGKYDVYVWYSQGSNRSAKVPWTVYYKGGSTTTAVNQQVRGGEWVPIAAGVPFDSGKNEDQYVEVTNGTGETTSAMVVADAVAFVYAGD